MEYITQLSTYQGELKNRGLTGLFSLFNVGLRMSGIMEDGLHLVGSRHDSTGSIVGDR